MSLALLKTCDYDLVSGGGIDDCKCIKITSMPFDAWSYNDIDDADDCKDLCCPAGAEYYQLLGGDPSLCPGKSQATLSAYVAGINMDKVKDSRQYGLPYK